MKNYIIDKKISLKAKGLLLLMNTVFNKSRITVNEICDYTKESMQEVVEILSEISGFGYCISNFTEDIFNGKQYSVVFNMLENSKNPKLDISIVSPQMMPVVEQWLAYKKEKGQSYKPIGFKTFYKKLCELSGNNPDVAIQIVENSMQNNYAGIFPLKNNNLNSNNAYPKSVSDVKPDDINSTLIQFQYWLDRAAPTLCDNLRGGWPETEQQYQNMIKSTVGGATALSYVVLVFNRDGWDEYYDERGFMWTYLNYIKANGLYEG